MHKAIDDEHNDIDDIDDQNKNFILGVSDIEEYNTLSAQEIEEMMAEFIEFQKSKTYGLRSSARSKVSDATHSLKFIQDEVFTLLSYNFQHDIT